MADQKQGKQLTYQMKSPGDAWMDFVNSKDGHNAAPVTPGWQMKEQNVPSKVDQQIQAKQQQQVSQQPDHSHEHQIEQTKQQAQEKNKGMERGR